MFYSPSVFRFIRKRRNAPAAAPLVPAPALLPGQFSQFIIINAFCKIVNPKSFGADASLKRIPSGADPARILIPTGAAFFEI